jgi:hypothetical protein
MGTEEQAAKGAAAQEHEDEALVAGPGVVGTKSMWKGAAGGALLGAIVLGVAAFLVMLMTGNEGRLLAIAAIVGAAGGGVAGFVAGGFLLPRKKNEVERENNV